MSVEFTPTLQVAAFDSPSMKSNSSMKRSDSRRAVTSLPSLLNLSKANAAALASTKSAPAGDSQAARRNVLSIGGTSIRLPALSSGGRAGGGAEGGKRSKSSLA